MLTISYNTAQVSLKKTRKNKFHPSSLLQMYAFEKATKQIAEFLPITVSSPTAKTLTHFIAGSIAASVAVVSCQPMDVLRTRFVGQGEPKVCSLSHQSLNHSLHSDLYVIYSSNKSRLDSRRFPGILSRFNSRNYSLCTYFSIDIWIL